MATSTPTDALPKTKKKGRRKGISQAQTFAALIKAVGEEGKDYHGLPATKREIVVRMLYDLLLEGKMSFPDGREIVLDYDSWESLAWGVIRHLDITAANAIVAESGALTASALTTNVILYMPTNARDQVNAQVVYQDEASKELTKKFPSLQTLIPGGTNGWHEE